MDRSRLAWLGLLTMLGGCVSTGDSPMVGCSAGTCGGGVRTPLTVPGVQGPYGQPVIMAAQYTTSPPASDFIARSMMANSVPLDMVMNGPRPMGMPAPPSGYPHAGIMPISGASSGLAQAGGASTPGAPSGLVQASSMSMSDAPSGIMQANGSCPGGACPAPTGGCGWLPPGAVAAVGAMNSPCRPHFNASRSSIRFVSPAGMKISWLAPTADGKAGFTTAQVEAPGRYNFTQGAVYRLKLTDVPNRPGLELYPTLEVVPASNKSYPFLAHATVPVSFTDEDFDQVAAGNMVVKVIYLPDPHFQDVANVTDELVSSRLDPGVDPVVEAHRRGSILVVIRIGNIDLEAPNTPAMDAPCAYVPRPAAGMAMMPGMVPGRPGAPGAMGQGGMPQMMMGPNGPMMMGPNGPMMMGPNGPMAGQGNPMMGPNGPMMMGPNGPIMMVPTNPSAKGIMTGNPGMLPNSMPPAAVQPGGSQIVPTLPPAPSKQSKAAPADSKIIPTTAALAAGSSAPASGQDDSSSTTDQKSAKKRFGWWFTK